VQKPSDLVLGFDAIALSKPGVKRFDCGGLNGAVVMPVDAANINVKLFVHFDSPID